MCGRYTIYNAEAIQKRFDLSDHAQFVSKDNYNVAPRQRLPIILSREGKRTVETMQWGYIPFWAKDISKERRPINTRAENAFESRLWKHSAQHQRCIVPSRGFYEWKKVMDASGKIDHKIPYFIHPTDQELFGFAGIYSIWNDVEGHPLYTFSIITTAANKEMEPIHDRMPVILRPEQEALWLDESLDDPAVLAELLQPYPDGHITMHRVTTDVNTPRNNSDQLILPVDED